MTSPPPLRTEEVVEDDDPTVEPTSALDVELHPEPTRGKSYVCRGCGADLHFAIGADRLECPHCGRIEEIPKSAAEITELDYHEYLDASRADLRKPAELEVRCAACGATVFVDSKTQTSSCAFCSTPFEAKPHEAAPRIEPAALLPFKVDERGAKKLFFDWVKSRWFAPSSFVHIGDLGKLVGMYTPYWTYDAMTQTFYRGERGVYYYVTETYTTTENGRPVQRTRQVRRTRWTPASGQVRHWFDDVLVLASKGVPQAYAESLAPWDLENLVDFRPDYLRSLQTERYEVDLPTGFERAKTLMEPTIRQLVCQDIGGDTQRIHGLQTGYSGITFKHVLLPIWISAYRYHEKLFRVLINARTGEVQGERPWSTWKIASTVVAVLTVVGAAIYLFQ